MLKYYDDVDYTFTRKNGQTAAYAHQRSGNDDTKLYPYQKVEYFMPNKAASHAKHKSNLFSIKIMDSGLDSNSSSNANIDQELAKQIKRDLFNGMKQLADSIAPACT